MRPVRWPLLLCLLAACGGPDGEEPPPEPTAEQPSPEQPPPEQPAQPPAEQPPLPAQPPPAQPPPEQPAQPPTEQPAQRRAMADGIWHVRYSFHTGSGGAACSDDFRRSFEHEVEPRLTGYDDCTRRHSERRVPGGWELVVVDECPFSAGTLTLFQEDGASVATGTLDLAEYGDIDRTPAGTCYLSYDTTATRP